jgi:hypothetical protein
LVLLCNFLCGGGPSQREQNSPANWGIRRPATFEELQRHFKQPDKLYAPFAFWFWDAPLDREQVATTAAEMCRQGFNPGYIHGRSGLPAEQWLAPEWFEAVDAALRTTEQAGGYVGYCDEYNWPGAQVAGRMLQEHPDLQAMSLKWEIQEVGAGETAQLPESFFTVAAEIGAGKQIRSATLKVLGGGQAFAWTAPAGHWRVYSFSKYPHSGLDGSPICYLDERLPDLVIQMVHEPYVRKFGQRLGRNMIGVFMDHEGDYGWKLCWSDTLAQLYQQRYARDIREWMPLLIERDAEGVWPKARFDWLEAIAEIYCDGFFGKLSRWAESKGLYLTSHVWEESLLLQAEAVSDFMRYQRAITMPGTDSLVTKPLEVLEFKETQSVSEFENKRCCSEILGVVGWKMTPGVLKQAANACTAWGVSHLMPHGVFNNRNLNAIPYPPDFYIENPYWPYFHLWTDFARRASYVNSHGRTVPDVLLFNPLDSVWATIGEWLFVPQADVRKQVENINRVYHDAITRLTAARIEFLIGDRYYLRKMTVAPAEAGGKGPEHGARLVLGDFRFKAVVLPPLIVLPRDIAEKLRAFARAGGLIYTLGELPVGSTDAGLNDPALRDTLAALAALPSVIACPDGLAAELARRDTQLKPQIVFEAGEFALLQLHRRIDGHDFFWLGNNALERQECRVTIPGVAGAAAIWDCETGEIRSTPVAVTPAGARLALSFKPLEAYWLVFDPQTSSTAPPVDKPSSAAQVVRLDGPWRVRIDPATQPSLNPGVAKFFTLKWTAPWLKVGEQTQFRYVVDLPAAPERAQVRATADAGLTLWVNGQAVPRHSWDDLWQQVSTVELGGLLKAGRNVIAVQAGKPGGQGGLILEGDAVLPGGRVAKLATDPTWRCRAAPALSEATPKWIWHPTARGSNQTVYLRKTFDLEDGAKIAHATCAVSVDNEFVLYLNGTKIGASDNWMRLSTFDVTDKLRPDRNVIAIQARNLDGPCGALVRLTVQAAEGGSITLVSDGEWLAADEAANGWTDVDFNDDKWAKAAVLASYGDSPWGRFEISAVTQPPPAWAAVDFDDRSWTTAEALGVPPLAPWIDVPPELLALRGVEKPLESWLKWKLDRFTGYVDYTTTFENPAAACQRVSLDLGQVKHMAELFVNDQQAGERLWPPFEFDLTAALQPGTNAIRVRVGNLMTNEMMQYADRGIMGTWGWGYAHGDYTGGLAAPSPEELDAGLFGPVTVTVRAE